MNDTIVLRIHRRRKYRNIMKNLDRLGVKGCTNKIAKVSGKEIDKLQGQGVTDMGEVLEILKMNRTGEFLVRSKFAKQPNASSHYYFAYRADYVKDFIEFNFSIPKYCFGSNVMMFVPHLMDRDYNFVDCWRLEHNIEIAYDRLVKFIQQFFRMEFANVVIDPGDLEVHRIDVCFNQIFKSKEEALKYLAYQKRQKKKNSRDDEGVMRDYETSLMYVTQRYSAKIYHKGTEYKKNDLKEHERINKEKGRQYFNTSEYAAFADRMLRYELTIRHTMLNYLHKRHLFRNKCPHFQSLLKEYHTVEASKQKNDRIAKKIGELLEDEKEAYRKLHPYEKISQESRKIHKYVSKIITKRTFFVFALTEEEALYNKRTVNYDCDKALFSKGLLRLCLGKLVEFMDEFQVKELPPEDKIGVLIDEYNLRHKSKLPKTEMMNFYKDLQRFGSFKETKKFTYMSRATLYRYKQRFKKIGITDNNLIPLTEDGIPKAELNLRNYHYAHQYDYPGFLRKNSFLHLGMPGSA